MLIWNPRAPSDLRQNVLDGAHACTHPGTSRYVDGSGLGNDGVLTGYTNPSTEGWAYSETLGQWGNEFAGNEDDRSIVIPDSPSLDLSRFTVSAWVYARNPASETLRIVSQKVERFDPYTDNRSNWSFLADNRVTKLVHVYFGKGAALSAFAQYNIADFPFNQWVLLTATYDQVRLRIYQNGIEKHSDAETAVPHVSAVDDIWIGRGRYTQYYWDGMIASHLVYPFAIDPALIRWLSKRENKLYVQPTRKIFYAPTAPAAGWKPWLIAPSAHIYGGGIL